MSMSKRWRKLEAYGRKGQEDAYAGRPMDQERHRWDKLVREWYEMSYRRTTRPTEETENVRHHAAGPGRRRGGGVRQ